MFLGRYFKLAILSIRRSKWRSSLTVLGIVIGVGSVVTIVSLGEGVKLDIANQISKRGADLITVLPGQRVQRDDQGNIANINLSLNQTNVSFGEADYKTVQGASGVNKVVPFGKVVGVAENGKRQYKEAEIVATTKDLPAVINQELEFGSFFADDEPGSKGAVIGRRVAEELYGESAPLGKSIMIREREFIIRGVMEQYRSSSFLLPSENYNNTVFIPFRAGQELMSGGIQIYQILAKPVNFDNIEETATAINAALEEERSGQHDFTVLEQDENLALANSILDMITQLTAGIAGISLLVGGIGIMNIMLVAVSERTSEIGIRKAVGATNRQILYQFMTEAAVLSLLGGLIAIVASVFANFLLRIYTDFRPVITLQIVAAALVLALVVGIFFGVAPAIKAARKDPINALRHE